MDEQKPAFVYNPRPETVNIQVCGNWFEFKPEQVKLIYNRNIAHIMTTDKRDEGLVSVSETCYAEPTSEAAVKEKLIAKAQGISNRVRFLEKVKNNLFVSLQRDINKSGMQYDALLEATPGEKKALKELAMYKEMQRTDRDADVAELKALKDQIDGDPLQSNTGKTN